MMLNEIADSIPALLTEEEFFKCVSVLPEYDPAIVNAQRNERVFALSTIYDVYIPSPMSLEIYGKLYAALTRSLQKKGTRLSVLQQNENYRAVQGHEARGIIGGTDSFTIIGESGIGKSSAISRSISLLRGNQVIIADKPYCKVIPCVTVQCPFDCSAKGLLLDILLQVDQVIGTRYYEAAVRKRATTDMLIGSVAQVSLNHIGLLIVDEIQNVVGNKNGRFLIAMLTQLINCSGISICMVGTPECTLFFEQAMQLARRTVGLNYGPLAFDETFCEICKLLFSYQYVKQKVLLTERVFDWLYEHTRGIVGVLVTLIHDVQELAILSGNEKIDVRMLEEAYNQRLSLMHVHLMRAPVTVKRYNRGTVPCEKKAEKQEDDCGKDIVMRKPTLVFSSVVQEARVKGQDIIQTLASYNLLEEVRS